MYFFTHLSFLFLSFSVCVYGFEKATEGRISKGVHNREKRVIDNTPHANTAVKIEKVPYIVNIQRNGNTICGGSIISSTVILTAAHCFMKQDVTYTVESGSEYKDLGVYHNVIKTLIHPEFDAVKFLNDLALVKISPPIDLTNSPNKKIALYEGEVPPNTLGIFSGWGCTEARWQEFELRSIEIPIISLEQCQEVHRTPGKVTDKNICTLDSKGLKGSCYGDSGGPLVVDGQLVGVLSWARGFANLKIPEVYMKVSNLEYQKWIISNTFESKL